MMFCPNCGFSYEEGDHFCSVCGTPLAEPAVPAPRRKHTVWPPILIMLVMVAIGFAVYFITASWQRPDAAVSEYPWFRVENGVLSFSEEAYTGGSELTIPNTVDGQTVTALEDSCFAGCDTLVSVVLPDSLTQIGSGAFRNCTSLRGIYIPASVVSLEREAFFGCQELEAVCFEAIPAGIASGSFDGCQSVCYIFFTGTFQEWELLYDDFINPYTYVICSDGVYPQGGQLP